MPGLIEEYLIQRRGGYIYKIREFGINPNEEKNQKRASGPPPRLRETKKYVAEPPPEAKGIKYISAGAPTGFKKAKDA